MTKLTRRKNKNKNKNKNNKTFKKGGSTEREGLLDMIGNKISDATSSAVTSATDAGLKIIGLERVDKPNEENINQNDLNKKIDEIGNATTETIDALKENANTTTAAVQDAADKTTAAVLNDVNEVLASEQVTQATEQAAQDTADIMKKSSEIFNEAMDDPEVKAEVKEAIDNAGEIATITVKAMEKPLDEAVNVAAKSTEKITGAALSGAVRVATDVAAAVPGVGGVIDLLKAFNDGSKAVSAVIEASSEAVEASSDATKEFIGNFDEGIKELKEKKKISEEINNRTTESINEFQEPLKQPNNTTGGSKHKTKRRLFKRKLKSKKVRFNV